MESLDDSVTADIKFSIVPEWLIDSGCTDKALRLYVVLARYADNENLTAYPGRGTLAKRMGCHRASVDRAVDELVQLGAITKQVRVKDGNYQSSLYTVRRLPPSRTHATTPVAPVQPPPSHPCDIELEPKNIEPKNIDATTLKVRLTSMTEQWQPDPENLQQIRQRHPSVNVNVELANFRDHWIGKGERRASWDATLRTWMRNAEKWGKAITPDHKPPTRAAPDQCPDCYQPLATHDSQVHDLLKDSM